jgi:hypothetical protein
MSNQQNLHRSSATNCECLDCRTPNATSKTLSNMPNYNNGNHVNNQESKSINMYNNNTKNPTDPNLLFQLQQQQQHQQQQRQQLHHQLKIEPSHNNQSNGSFCSCQDCFQSLNKQQQMTNSSYYMKQVNQLSIQQNKNHTNGHQQSASTFQNYQQSVGGGGYHATNNSTKQLENNNNSSIHEKYLNKVLSKATSIPINTLSTTYQNSLTNQHEMLAKSKSTNNFNNPIMIPHQIMLPAESNEFISNGLPIKKLKNDLYTSPSPHSILTGTKSIANTNDFYKNSSQSATIQNMNKHNRKPSEADYSATNIKPPFQSVPSKAEILNNSSYDTSKFALFNL